MDSYISKQVNLAHCKVIIFSEEVAKDGIGTEIFSLFNNIQVRPDTAVIVSKCNAKDFIQNSKPDLESSLSQFYEIIPKSSEYTGFTDYITMGKFYNNLCSDTTETYAILGGLNTGENTNTSGESNNSQKDLSTTAGETSFEDKPAPETIGLAVFKGDKLVGELSAIESICHLILNNDFESSTISIPDPSDSSKTIDLYLYRYKKNKIDVNFINGAPYVKVKCNLSARMLTIHDNTENASTDRLDSISEATEIYLEEQISSYLYKTAKIYKSDISGIGKHAIRKFTTIEEWKNYDWLNNYQNSFFEVDVNTSVKSGLLLTEN